MLSEYSPAVRDGRAKDLILPGWFFPPSISPLAGSLILALIHVDPQQRFTAAEALRHPWSTGEGRPGSPDALSVRNQTQGMKNLLLEEGKDKEKLKPKVHNKEQREKRNSAPSPYCLSAAQTTQVSQASTPRINKPKSPPKSPPISPPATVISVQFPATQRSGSPDRNSPTRFALASVATALASFSREVVEVVIPEEIIITEEIRHIRPQQSDVRVISDENLIHRVDSVSITLIEPFNQQVQAVTRNRTSQTNLSLASSSQDSTVTPCSIPLSPPIPPRQSLANSAPVISQVIPVSVITSVTATADVNRGDVQQRSDQSQQSSAPRFTARSEQSRDRVQGQDREEQERKQRYQSMLEQQRQKEAAALAHRPQSEQIQREQTQRDQPQRDQTQRDQPQRDQTQRDQTQRDQPQRDQTQNQQRDQTASAANTANREPGRALVRGGHSTSTSIFTYSEVDAITENSDAQNQQINMSDEEQNIVSGTYFLGENNNHQCDKRK